MATQRDVADRAGVSLAVVSAVVSGTSHTRMSPATRAKVEAAMSELGYRPNLAARSLRLQQAGMIGVILPKLENPVYAPMIRGMYNAAAERGATVLFGDAEMMRPGSEFPTRLVARGAVDGIVVRGLGLLSGEMVAALQNHPTPVLALDRVDQFAWLGMDDARAGRLATRFLLDLGHRRIAFVGGEAGGADVGRYRGYVAEMALAGVAPADHLATGFGEQAGVEGLRRAWAMAAAPTAIVVNNIMSCVGVLAAAHDLGITVPGDVSIVGIHDVPLMPFLRPAVTAVRMPMYELGRAGVTGLYDMMDGRPGPNRVLDEHEPTLVVRDSVARLSPQ